MSDERELIAEREKKVQEIRALGANPYANGFSPTHTAAEIAAKFAGAEPPPEGGDKGAAPALLSDEHFKIAGRIVAYRGFGKAAFVKLLDRTGEIQVWIRKDLIGDAAFALWKLVERGDFIGVVGSPTITRPKNGAGELTIVAENVVVLTKATRPLPEKWHGLSDRRDPLPPALRRPDREPRGARGVPQAQRDRARHPPLPRRARLPRGRDADDAPDRRRRRGAAVQDPPQRARPRPQHAHRARAVPQAPGRRRLRAGLRDRPQLPQRGALAPAQPRVHDAGVLSGLRDLRGFMRLTEKLFLELAREVSVGRGDQDQGQALSLAPPGRAPDEGRGRRGLAPRARPGRASSGACSHDAGALARWSKRAAWPGGATRWAPSCARPRATASGWGRCSRPRRREGAPRRAADLRTEYPLAEPRRCRAATTATRRSSTASSCTSSGARSPTRSPS